MYQWMLKGYSFVLSPTTWALDVNRSMFGFIVSIYMLFPGLVIIIDSLFGEAEDGGFV